MGFDHTSLRGLWLALILACVNGLLYLFLVPPWQHYDEPGHFEYAWLIAHRPTLPPPDSYDSALRREVALSMVANDFYRGAGPPADLLETDPINIGFSQVDAFPVYYWLAALPLRLLSSSKIAQQLYAARVVSLLLFLLSIVGCWGILNELTRPNSPLRWLVPTCLALLPAYADVMTAVNNDVAAATFSTLLIWGLVHLIQRGFSIYGLLWCAAWATVCYWTKNTTYPVIAALVLALPLSLLKPHRRALVWVALGLAAAFTFLASTQWDEARGWLRLGGQQDGTRRATHQAQTGQYAFELNARLDTGLQIQQIVSADVVEALRGHTVTLGAWVWSESAQPQTAYTPALIIETTTASSSSSSAIHQDIQLIHQPTFHSFTTTLPLNTSRLWLALIQPQQPISGALFYDDVVFTRNDVTATENLAQNPSAEYSAARFTATWQELLTEHLGFDLNHFLGILLDRNLLKSYIDKTVNLSLQTFWARFAWGHVPLNNQALYPLLNAALVTSLLCSGYCLSLSRRSKVYWRTNGHSLAALGLIGVACCLAAFARATYILFPFDPWFPSARYAYPAVVPLLLAVIGGWVVLIHQASSAPLRRIGVWLIAGYFVALDLISLISIAQFYAVL